MKKIAIIGGGAAGFFAAINIKEMCREYSVTIFEKSNRVLRKVEISGGGRCNFTNTFANVKDLKHVYPRGHRLMKKLMYTFDNKDAMTWFENHGIPYNIQEDQCVFPNSQDSHTIINCFLNETRKHNIKIVTNKTIDNISNLWNYDYIVVATGGTQNLQAYQWLTDIGHNIEKPIPSLFSFNIDDTLLNALSGTVVENIKMRIAGTKTMAEGTLLITHWGFSGPATLLLSSYAARLLNEQNYNAKININWTGQNEQEISSELNDIIIRNGDKTISNYRPFQLPQRLWDYLLDKALDTKTHKKWKELGNKEMHRIVNILSNDTYTVKGRATYKDEFVTCGGICLRDIAIPTLQSKLNKKLFFAGEILDIDGITGGFNFQAAWTTAYNVALAICKQ